MPRCATALFVALAALLAGGEASAKRIVVLDFSGPRAQRFQRAVERMVADDHALIPSRRYKRASRRLRARRQRPRDVRRVARKLGVDGVVTGKVRRRRGRFVLEVRVRSGRSGKFFGKPVRARVRRAHLSGRAAQRVNRDLSRVLRRLPAAQARGDRAKRDRRAAERDRRDRERRELDRERRDRERRDRDRRDRDRRDRDGRAQRDRDRERRDRERRAQRDRGRRDRDRRDRDRRDRDRKDEQPAVSGERRADLEARSRGLDVEAGLAGLNRNLGFSVATDLGQQAPQGYSGSFVPAAFLRAELYPFAFSLTNESPKRDFGLSVVYEKVLQIESEIPGSDVVLPTDQQRYGLGAVFRKNFGDDPTSLTVKVMVHYNQASFTLDRAPAEAMGINVDLPNVTYTYFDPGLGARYPLSEQVALNARAHFLFITGTGEMGQEDQYGSATVSGFDLDANVEYRIKPRLLLRAGGRLMGFAFDFDGSGALTDRNGDMTQDVGGAFDRYLGGYATLGYLF